VKKFVKLYVISSPTEKLKPYIIEFVLGSDMLVFDFGQDVERAHIGCQSKVDVIYSPAY
jgi:hypothetical protein